MKKVSLFAAAIIVAANINAQPEKTETSPVNIVIVGDSTVQTYKTDNPDKPIRGWGQVIDRFFNDKVKINNFALSGRSTKTFIEQGYWNKALAATTPGSFVLIQFGHNDSHGKGKPESTDANADYKEYLKKYVDDVKAKNATPIFVTPMHRGIFKNDKITQELLPYVKAMQDVAREKDIVCIDLYTPSGKAMQEMGKEGVAPIFCSAKDRTHFNEKGAVLMAELITKELAAQKTPLNQYLKK